LLLAGRRPSKPHVASSPTAHSRSANPAPLLSAHNAILVASRRLATGLAAYCEARRGWRAKPSLRCPASTGRDPEGYVRERRGARRARVRRHPGPRREALGMLGRARPRSSAALRRGYSWGFPEPIFTLKKASGDSQSRSLPQRRPLGIPRADLQSGAPLAVGCGRWFSTRWPLVLDSLAAPSRLVGRWFSTRWPLVLDSLADASPVVDRCFSLS
jgi:hypothetical protein